MKKFYVKPNMRVRTCEAVVMCVASGHYDHPHHPHFPPPPPPHPFFPWFFSKEESSIDLEEEED